MATTRTGHEAPGTPRPLWERQPCDTNASWPYFKAYRDIPPGIKRTLASVRFRPAQTNHHVPRDQAPTLQELNQWCIDHNWIERVAEYDKHLDHVHTQEVEGLVTESGRELAAKHLAMLQDAYQLAVEELQKFLRQSETLDAAPTLKMGDLNKLMENVVKLQRLVKGETTDSHEVRADLSKLSPEQLRQYLELVKLTEEG